MAVLFELIKRVGLTPDPADAGLFSGAGSFESASEELFKVTTEVTIEHLALTVLSFFITFFGLYSGFIKERLYVGEAIIATVFGIAFSGYAAGIFAPRTWSEGHHFDEITLELTRIIIALSVFAVGVELPKAYVLRHWKSLTILLGPVMLFGWMVSAALMYAIIPGLDFLPALVVAAGVTPTDPILASSVVGKGKFAQDHVPAHIRHILQAESGSNDGAAFPFLYLALFLLLREHHSVGETIGYWILLVVLYQIVLGIFIGAMVGILARKLLKFSKRRELIDRESMVALYVSLALLVTGLTTLAGSDDLLAAFACGTAFAWDDWFTESIEESNFSSTIDLLANCAMFIYLGATMPFSAWSDPNLTLTPWRLVLLAIGILALRRLPSIFALQWWIPDIKTRREAIFAGHFGPMGVGAIFISTLAASKLPTPNIPPQNSLDILSLSIQPITYFIVLSSILIHGLTISFFSLGRRVHSRVQSISRTFTQNSRNGEEPSWMSRVKRAQGQDIIINRDDEADDPSDLAEKGAAVDLSTEEIISDEKGDEFMVDRGMMGLRRDHVPIASTSASTSSSTSATAIGTGSQEKEQIKEDSEDEQEVERREGPEAEIERENDEHPSENVLVDHPHADRAKHRKTDDDDSLEKADKVPMMKEENAEKSPAPQSPRPTMMKRKESAHEARYCKTGETRTWTEGRKIIIDHGDGENVQVIDLDPSQDDLQKAEENPRHRTIDVPRDLIEAEKARSHSQGFESPKDREDSAVKNVVQKMRRGSIVAAATALIKKDDGLTQAERDAKTKAKLDRDAWCRKEQHYRDRDDSSERKEWIEGSKIVTEEGEKVTVRQMTAEEKDAKAAKHIAALSALGIPHDYLTAELAKLTKITSRSSDLAKISSRTSDLAKTASRDTIRTPELTKTTSRDRTGLDYFGAKIKGKGKRAQSPAPAALDEPQSMSRSRSRSPVPTTPPPVAPSGGSGGDKSLTLTRTSRIDEDSDEEEEVSSEEDSPKPKKTSSPVRGAPGKGKGFRNLLFGRKPSLNPASISAPVMEEDARGRDSAPGSRNGSRAPSPTRSIRFADPSDRPARETAATGRALPVLGGSLSMRRTPTIPTETSIRFADAK